MTDNRYDVIIIGTGAGGGTLAYHLAPSGKRILILERGDYVPREKANWDPQVVNVDAHYNTKESWLDKDCKDLHPHTNYNVGGNTKFYGAALFRLRKEDFGELRHHGGISPAWPIRYDELEPYYTQAENLYQVHGNRGEDPTEPPASAPYKFPAVSHEPRIQQLSDDFARSGLKPFHEAIKHPNVTLLTNSLVKRLETDSSGREVKSVLVERNGGLETYSADIVVVSGGAINSAALLLRSANNQHPRGLANSSDVVGRHYMGHTNSVMMAISKCPNPTIFQKTLGVNDFYFGSQDFPYPMGHISFVGKLDAITLKAGAPAIAPNFTLELMAKHSLDFWLTSEDLPDPNNRVAIGRDGKIVLRYTPNNLEAHERLQAKLKQAMKQTNCTMHGHECHQGLFSRNLYVGQTIPLAGVAHQNGTIRFGHDPKTSVLDANCKAHDLDNLYVVDGSFFPSSAAVNPALTIMANALRVGDHLLGRLGVSASEYAQNGQRELAVTG